MDVVVAHGSGLERAMLAATLEQVGCEVRDASSADAALALCREHAPEVVVADAELCSDGELPLLERLKRDPALFGVAVVLIVEVRTPEEVIDYLDRGAQDVVMRPLRPGDLVARVRAAARTKNLQDELLKRGRDLEDLLFGDPLTKLFNRRFILTQLTANVNSARRHGRDIAACIIDIDHFKEINDTFGHAAGDHALVHVAERLSGRIREEDQLGRIGGEEFLLLLPDTSPPDAVRVAEDLRAAVCDRPLEIDGVPRPVTVSIGWAGWDGQEEPSSLLRRADQALYRAKQEGRDRVCGPLGGPGARRFRRTTA